MKLCNLAFSAALFGATSTATSNVLAFASNLTAQEQQDSTTATTSEASAMTLNEDAFDNAPAKTKVECKGINEKKFTLADGTYLGNVVTAVYNAIHETGDGAHLSDTMYFAEDPDKMGAGVIAAKVLLGEDGQDDGDEKGMLKIYSRFNNYQNWFYNYYPKWFSGTWACGTLCHNDDVMLGSSNKMLFASSDPDLDAWETEVTAQIKASGRAAFAKVSHCTITLSPANHVSAGLPNADIHLQCKASDTTLNLHNLPLSQGSFLASAVQTTYNKAHGDAPEDDSTLENVFYRGGQKDTKATLKEQEDNVTTISSPPVSGWFSNNSKWTSKTTLGGTWTCRLCNDDTVDETLWAAELVVALKEGPFDYFHTIDECEIAVAPHAIKSVMMAMLDQEQQNSGGCALRGGSDCATE